MNKWSWYSDLLITLEAQAKFARGEKLSPAEASAVVRHVMWQIAFEERMR